ncbi:STY4534 family ICE replication protein [Algiphilus sp. W345]|uniref:STY4534 family ICE replication protein n=1 Tax=Banduia mediterranea TaxID=3075609 RepID=A0ABU2WL50_9GAMM|nr:STY4534 family ICE replication protein [Algiphilus sp. W345]MDT0498600.1 STY4534 family ICE replication protein [Algiphilus sp. W345]
MPSHSADADATSGGDRYFNLHTTGIGYLNRAREVPVKKGAFLAVDVTALRGSADEVEYTRLDCRVSGREAQSLVRRLKPDIDARKKVLVGFKTGDLYPETFVYENGERKGQTGVSLKAHLLRITWAKVDGVTVYTAPSDAPTEPADTAPATAIA